MPVHDHPRRGPVVLRGLRPRRRQRGPRACRSTRRAAKAQWPRHVTEGWMSIWDLAKPVIAQVHGYCLAGGERARDRLRPRLHGRGRADGLSRGALRRARHALPRVVPRHAQGDGDDAHRRLDLRHRGGRARAGPTRAFPADELDDARARDGAAASRRSRPSSCSSTSASCTARWTPWACAPASAPAPSCARSARTRRRCASSSATSARRASPSALQERDAPFGDYRTGKRPSVPSKK